MVAAFVGCWPLVEQLINEGMKVTETDKQGSNALYWANQGWGGGAMSALMVRHALKANPDEVSCTCATLESILTLSSEIAS